MSEQLDMFEQEKEEAILNTFEIMENKETQFQKELKELLKKYNAELRIESSYTMALPPGLSIVAVFLDSDNAKKDSDLHKTLWDRFNWDRRV